MLTALDQIANQNHLQLIKAILPYVSSASQPLLSVCIKILEIQNILNYYRTNTRCIGACGANSQPPELLDLLTDMKNYSDETEQGMIDQCIQLLTTLELYSVFAQNQDGSMAETIFGNNFAPTS